MRPVRLELEGFTSFRARTEIDFDGVNYFALVGPTGSGKSSIIDAICFVLYGSIPRYDNKALISPVVTGGSLEAKVRLDFTVGPDLYTAVRIVRKNAQGAATVKEARLEKAGVEVPLAGTGPELTAAVTELLGLPFEHFTKCVVLPQGDFARFLHDPPKVRQEFLVRLLNLGLYERMAREANARATVAQDRRNLLLERLESASGDATPERLTEAKARLKRLARLRKEVSEAEPALQTFEKQIADGSDAAEEAAEWLEVIEELEVPGDVEALSDEITAAKKLLAEAEGTVKDVRAKARKAEKLCESLPARPPLDAALLAHDELDKITVEIEAAGRTVTRAVAAEAGAAKALAAAVAAEGTAAEAVESARSAHQAVHLAQGLTEGEPCPVCLHPVATLPQHAIPAEIGAAETALVEARRALEEARTVAGTAAQTVAREQAHRSSLQKQREALSERVAEHKERNALEATLTRIEQADAGLKEARKQEGAALDAADDARKSLEHLQHRVDEQREELAEARDTLASLKPPKPGNKDLAADWEALLTWAEAQVAPLSKKLAEAEKAVAKAEKAMTAQIDKLAASCVDCDLELDAEDNIVEIVVAAHTEAERAAKDIEEAMAAVKDMRVKAEELTRDYEVAHELGLHLSAKPGRFVSWIVNEALERLVEGATQILSELSGGQYSLRVDENGTFFVADLNNAGELRSARTLSGGETFLASLSLALALADQLGELAAEGAAKLEAIFLDEGFGTLDPETLETVAATVENLAAGGRMVGVITHVRELAEQIETKFRVKKDVSTSTVEKVATGG